MGNFELHCFYPIINFGYEKKINPNIGRTKDYNLIPLIQQTSLKEGLKTTSFWNFFCNSKPLNMSNVETCAQLEELFA